MAKKIGRTIKASIGKPSNKVSGIVKVKQPFVK